jgi:rare lipoprotein A
LVLTACAPTPPRETPPAPFPPTREIVPEPPAAPPMLSPDGAPLSGIASWYGKTGNNRFHGKKTASGERFDRALYTAASNRFPLKTWLAVRRPDNGRCVVVWVNDRMHKRHKKRIVDLSEQAAKTLDLIHRGIAPIEARPVRLAPELANTAKREAVEAAVCGLAFEAKEKGARNDQNP